MTSLIVTQEKEWARSHLTSILKEIDESNGKISEIFRNDSLIRVMSQISNFIRYDIISKNEIVTYKIPQSISNDINCLFS